MKHGVSTSHTSTSYQMRPRLEAVSYESKIWPHWNIYQVLSDRVWDMGMRRLPSISPFGSASSTTKLNFCPSYPYLGHKSVLNTPTAFSSVTSSLAKMASPIVPQENGVGDAISSYKPRYIDVRTIPMTASAPYSNADPSTDRPKIGINLADPIFRGVYNGKQRHEEDLSDVVDRARQVGCNKLIVTGSSFKSSRDALALAKEYREILLAMQKSYFTRDGGPGLQNKTAHTIPHARTILLATNPWVM